MGTVLGCPADCCSLPCSLAALCCPVTNSTPDCAEVPAQHSRSEQPRHRICAHPCMQLANSICYVIEFGPVFEA